MIIERFGISLHTLQEQHIEQVRSWRNSPFISENLIERKHITSSQQALWFKSIQNEQNAYFIIKVNEENAGLVYLTNINWTDLTFEANMFMGSEKFVASTIPVYASLSISDLFFFELGFKKAFSKYFIKNDRSAQFDSGFGFSYIHKQDDSLIYNYATRHSYLQSSEKLRLALYRSNPQNQSCVIKFNPINQQSDIEIKISQSLSAYSMIDQTNRIILSFSDISHQSDL